MLITFLDRLYVKLNFESWQNQKKPPTWVQTMKS